MMAPIIDASISHARTVLSIFVLLIISGTYAYVNIPKESSPDVDIPQIYISMHLEGISPDDSERLLLRPMEQELTTIEGVKEMTASAYQGGGFVLLEFQAGFDKDKALDDVQKAVDQARPELPEDVEEPSVTEVNFSLFPVLVVTLSGDVPERTLLRLGRQLQDKIEAIPAVLESGMAGDRDELVEIIVKPELLESYGLVGTDIINFFNLSNRLVAAGTMDTGAGRFAIEVPGLFEDVQDIMAMPLRTDGDSAITVADIAEIRRTFKDPDNFARLNGERAIALEVVKRAGENIIDTIEDVRAVVAEEQKLWPEAVKVNYTLDESEDIRTMLRDLQNNVISAILLVMIVVVWALGIRAAGLVGIAIPGAFLTGILVLFLMGLTVNVVVLFSLILSVGMLVDGAIVVVELADRKMAEGKHRKEAYAIAAKRMAWPIISSTATTLAAFAPLLFWPGIVGEFMGYMPLTLIAVLTASLLMALVFVPTWGSLFGKAGAIDGKALKSLAASETGDLHEIGGFTGWYVNLLDKGLNIPDKIIATAVALLFGVMTLYSVPEVNLSFAFGVLLLAFTVFLINAALVAIAEHVLRKAFLLILFAGAAFAMAPTLLSTDQHIFLSVIMYVVATPILFLIFTGLSSLIVIAFLRLKKRNTALDKSIENTLNVLRKTLGAYLTFVVVSYIFLAIHFVSGPLGKGVEFFPEIEPEFASVLVHARGNMSVYEKDKLVREVEDRILGMDGIETVYTRAGEPAQQGSDLAEDVIGQLQVQLMDWDQRKPANEILEDIRTRTADLAGLYVETRKAEEGPPTGKAVQVQIASRFPQHLNDAAQTVRNAMDELGDFRDVEDSRPLPGIDWEIDVNRSQAAKFGLDITTIGYYIRMVTNGLEVAEYRPDDSDDEIDIVIRHDDDQRTLDQLDRIRIELPGRGGIAGEVGNGSVPISSFVERKATPAVGVINRADQRRIVTVKADLPAEVNINAKVEELRAWIENNRNQFHPSIEIDFKGEDEDQRESQTFLMKAFGVALFIMAIILVTQFNSFYSAFLILTAVIMSTIGVMIGLMVTGQPFGIVMSGVGVIALAGIIVNNNIVLIDTFDHLRNTLADKMPMREIILRTGAQRLRPVLLTTVTTVVGLMPMVLQVNIDFITREVNIGAPSTQWWVQLATALVSGLIFSTILTLIVTPSALMLRENFMTWWSKKTTNEPAKAST